MSAATGGFKVSSNDLHFAVGIIAGRDDKGREEVKVLPPITLVRLLNMEMQYVKQGVLPP